MTQMAIEMFDMPRARRRDPETSKRAGINAATFASSHAGRILQALRQHGPMSPAQMFTFTGLSVVQCDRRRKEMIGAGLVRVQTDAEGNPVEHDGCEVWEAV